MRVKGETSKHLAEATIDEKGFRHFNLPGRLFALYDGQAWVPGPIPAFGEPATPEDEAVVLKRAIERMGWPEIRTFQEELSRGQAVYEDAGAY